MPTYSLGGGSYDFGVSSITNQWWMTQPFSATGTYAPTINQLIVAPILIPVDTVIQGVGIRIITGTATATMRIGIYDADTGVPTNLMYESTNIDASTTGNKTITDLSVSLSSGLYYVGAVAQTASPASVQAMTTSASTGFLSFANATAGGADFSIGSQGYPVSSATVSGSLPSTFTYGGIVSPAPRVWLLAA